MYVETKSNAFVILQRALTARSAVLRVRAVAMLTHVDCALRMAWLETAMHDPDLSVRLTANAVMSYVIEPSEPTWPEREDPRFDKAIQLTFDGLDVGGAGSSDALRWEWEYVVEVWREDGLLVGVFLARTCSDDEAHAAAIGLGQAVLQSSWPGGEEFDSARAGAFVTGKRRIKRVRGPSTQW